MKAFPPHTRGWTRFISLRRRRWLVSPAHAGMDLPKGRLPLRSWSFPRTRGDGGFPWGPLISGEQFPPHTRGWTVVEAGVVSLPRVSPAHAGMDRKMMAAWRRGGRFPRARGDGPSRIEPPIAARRFPPHTRGWTCHARSSQSTEAVSPAHAGMDRPGALRGRTSRSFPRTRGDGPLLWSNIQTLQPFPPHTRGWTLILLHPGAHLFVSPAHAGMDRTRGRRTRGPHRFPRTRGDGPAASPRIALRLMFPPHTRGWTAGAHARAVRRRVSPAHAGMDRGASWCTGSLGCFPRTRVALGCFPRTRGDGPSGCVAPGILASSFPRTRGDGPYTRSPYSRASPFPPHTRGWTRGTSLGLARCFPRAGMDGWVTTPAHAGMDLSFPRTRGDGPMDESLMLNSAMFPPHTRGWTVR